MQKPQGIRDKVEIEGATPLGKRLHLTAPPNEVNLAKSVLVKLNDAQPLVGWDVDIQDGMITIWSYSHPQWAWRKPLHFIGKGGRYIPKIAAGLLERIKAETC